VKAQSLIDLLHEFRKVGAGNALAAGNFAHCTCPKPPGMKTKSAEEVIADAKKDPNTKELDRLIDSGHTEFLRRCFVFHPDEDKERLAKRDDWVLLNPKNGDELLLKTPLARAYGHLRAHTHRPETHTNETNGATKQAAPRKRVVKPKEEEKPAFTWGSAPDAFFHGTTEDIAAKILKSGLNPHVEDRANLSAKGYVYLSRSAHGAAQWGKAQAQKRGGKAALIRVVLPPELLKKVEVDDWEIGVDTKNDCRFKGSIPASCCSIYPMQGSEGGYGWNYASVKTAKDYGDKWLRWVDLPEGAVLGRNGEWHMDILERLGKPTAGPAFDRIPRGSAEVDHANKMVTLRGYKDTFPSNAVYNAIQKKYPNYTINEMALSTTAKLAADYQNEPTSIDLGDGFTLSYTPHPNERADGDSNTWQITNPSVPYKVGEVLLHFYEDVPHPSIGTISFDQHFQRKGLGRKVVQALSQFYGGLTSDPQRNTNDSAKGMWRGVPGVQEVPSPKRYQHGDKPAERRLPWETDEFLNRGKYFTVQRCQQQVCRERRFAG